LGVDGFAFLRDGAGFVTAGEVARVALDDAQDLLATIAVDDPVGRPGTGAIAIGALPFDRAAGGMLAVPGRVYGRAVDGQCWITEISASQSPAPAPVAMPSAFVVKADSTRDEWRKSVHRLLDAIARGDLEKAVLARSVTVTADMAFAPGAILAHLREAQPGCCVYAAGGLVGASPELLVQRRGTSVESRPMAGTARTEDAIAQLLASAKNRLEHHCVVAAVADALTPLCEVLDVSALPTVVRLANLAHLATEIRGELLEPAPSALELARLLHPTPAVGGMPRDVALQLIAELEPIDRGCYAGPIGWVDAQGDGEWVVALRSAELDGCRARLFGGAGIVAGSDPDDEWAETEAKLAPMLQALVRP
jgi:menaquinone-specific isochorismate synthase